MSLSSSSEFHFFFTQVFNPLFMIRSFILQSPLIRLCKTKNIIIKSMINSKITILLRKKNIVISNLQTNMKVAKKICCQHDLFNIKRNKSNIEKRYVKIYCIYIIIDCFRYQFRVKDI